MIRIKKRRANDLLSYLAIFVAFLCATNGELANTKNNVVYYLPFVICLGALGLELSLRKRIVLSSYMLWRIVLTIFFLIAYLYAVNVSLAFVAIKKLILQSIALILIGLKCNENADNIPRFIKLAVIAIFANLLYVAATVDMTMLEEGIRLGVTSVNEAWNANQIGLMASMGAAMVYYTFFIKESGSAIISKVLGVALTVFFLVFVVLSGSRKSLIIVFVTLMLYLLGSSKSHRIRSLLIAVVCACGIIYALFNTPFLYEYIGYRFEGLREALSGEGGDHSSHIRRGMIEIGMRAFAERPLFGYGLNGFAHVYNSMAGTSVYSHNNYVELLVNTGLVGFLLYYGYIATILFKRCAMNKETVLYKAMLIALLVAEIGLVSYTSSFCQYILCLIVCGILKNPFASPEKTAVQQ